MWKSNSFVVPQPLLLASRDSHDPKMISWPYTNFVYQPSARLRVREAEGGLGGAASTCVGLGLMGLIGLRGF